MNPTKTRRRSLSQSAPPSPIETLISFDPDPSPNPNHSAESHDWSSLTDAALHSVLSRLSSLEDFFAFRAPPLLLVPRFPSFSESFYDLLRRRLYSTRLPWSPPSRRSLAFSHGFLITISSASASASASASGPSKLLLWNLLSGARIRLPKSPHRLPRVILSSSPASSSPACSVVCFRPCSQSLQFCSLGDPLWKFHTFSNAPIIHDMIFFRGRLYALTPGRRLAAVDLVPRPEFTLLGPSIDPNSDDPGNKNYCKWTLAESGGNLLLVGTYLSMQFSVFRWDFEGGGWRELPDLGGRALFLEDKGFAASVVPTCPAVKGNCIYYADHRESVYYEFSLEDRSRSTISLNPSSSLPHHPGAHVPKIWVFPSLCCF
uniref:KIB1-4 beta-propeller domain-containing protein n=1 Tax=Ananas comosus var. bracteatus TaxID=296719 RepID=A0A6V7NS86_ANACO|nr:unnamed protein product [Ananas comosus var. bracteatus]